MASSRATTPSQGPRGVAPSCGAGAGAKRARTGTGSGTRDWSDVGGDGPARLIAELALASGGVADYVRFRAACRAWRRCAPDPRDAGLDARFLPRDWVMLDQEAAPAAQAEGPRRRHRFLNVSTGECVRTELPELAAHRFLALTPEGLLLLLDRATLAVRLLNPLTRQLTGLPPATTLPTVVGGQERRPGDDDKWGEEIRVRGAGLVDAPSSSSAVVVDFFFPTVLAVAKPGDEGWTAVVVARTMNSTLPFAGGFYCATSWGVTALDTSCNSEPPRLRLVASASAFVFSVVGHMLHLVDNGGELLLVVHRKMRRERAVVRVEQPGHVAARGQNQIINRIRPSIVVNSTSGSALLSPLIRIACERDAIRRRRPPADRAYHVYRVDLDAGALVPVTSLNGRAVFMGMRRAISVQPEVFPSAVGADTIYLASDCDRQTLGYNVAHGSRETRRHEPFVDGWVGPYSVVECLCYCIHGVGQLLVA